MSVSISTSLTRMPTFSIISFNSSRSKTPDPSGIDQVEHLPDAEVELARRLLHLLANHVQTVLRIEVAAEVVENRELGPLRRHQRVEAERVSPLELGRLLLGRDLLRLLRLFGLLRLDHIERVLEVERVGFGERADLHVFRTDAVTEERLPLVRRRAAVPHARLSERSRLRRVRARGRRLLRRRPGRLRRRGRLRHLLLSGGRAKIA